MPSHEPRDRSVSGDFELDSDLESHHDEQPGKPGRKKNPNSQAARRDQNRIAQREFRLRKQQRIRDLEARVEILSGGKDEALGEMRNMLKDLMEENQTLRNLLRNLATFIGDGAGGLLPKLGWETSDFNNFVNRSETDTAWEGYQKRKKQTAAATTAESGASATSASGLKRAADEEPAGSRSKKSRSSEQEGDGRNSFSLITSANSTSLATNGLYPTGSRSHDVGGMFSDLMRTSSNSPSYVTQQASPTEPPAYSGSYQTSYGGNMMEPSFASLPFSLTRRTPVPVQQSLQQQQQQSAAQASTEPLEDDDPNKHEAYKLISYHLDNFKRNNNYCLPSSLRPTLIQTSIPHESVIDVILHAELRDRMILLRDRYDLVECLIDYRAAVTIHGDDVLAHSNWEIGEKFLRKYGFLIDATTLNAANRWRKERGEPEIRSSDIGSVDTTPPA